MTRIATYDITSSQSNWKIKKGIGITRGTKRGQANYNKIGKLLLARKLGRRQALIASTSFPRAVQII